MFCFDSRQTWAQARYILGYDCLRRECFDMRVSSLRPDNDAPSTAPRAALEQHVPTTFVIVGYVFWSSHSLSQEVNVFAVCFLA